MKKTKKLLLTMLSVALVAIIGVFGTVAYLTGEDSDVNVMTLGNVEIEQHEYERVQKADGTYATKTIDDVNSYVLQPFTQAKPLYPIVGDPNEPGDSPAYAGWDDTIVRMTQVDSYGSMQVFAGKNAQDKFVTVENTGKSDAYVRTLVAIEIGSSDGSKIGTSDRAQEANATGTQPWIENSVGTVEIDGYNYMVREYVYRGASDVNRHVNGVLPAGETTYPSFCQVYLKHNATNEDMTAIDGNGNGTLDILVVSQAVQTEGFADAQTALDTAFGKASEKAAEWFEKDVTVEASDANDMAGVLVNGGNIILAGDVTSDNIEVAANADVTMDLQDKKLGATVLNYGDLEVSGGSIEKEFSGFENYGTATLTDVTVNAGTPNDYAVIGRAGSLTTLDNADVNSKGGGVGVAGGAKAVFNSGSVYVDSASTSGRYVFYVSGAGSELTINGGDFSWDPNDNQKRAYIYADAGTTVYVNGGTFGKASTRSGYTAGILGEGTVIITGGTFGFDPSAWVDDGYEAVKSGSTWIVSAK